MHKEVILYQQRPQTNFRLHSTSWVACASEIMSEISKDPKGKISKTAKNTGSNSLH
jgi:hypothetical protein